ncbi:MAG: M15 family metallopeptidase [Clostridia bacterium]
MRCMQAFTVALTALAVAAALASCSPVPTIPDLPASLPGASLALPEDTPDPQEEAPCPTPSPESITETPPASGMEALPYYREENKKRYALYQEENPGMPEETVVLHVNIGVDVPFYGNVRIIQDPDSLEVLVNKYYRLPDGYVPGLVELDLALCTPGVAAQYLRPKALEAFTRMHRDASELGLTITAYGTYRSIQRQQAIWENAVASGRSIEEVDSLNARGGHSEHNTGLAVDVIVNDYNVLDTLEYGWYRDHAHLYGFIIRYPEGKDHLTGYRHEPWHLRFLGVELATAVHESGLTYEEYLAMAPGSLPGSAD